jgi:hypothetical protein
MIAARAVARTFIVVRACLSALALVLIGWSKLIGLELDGFDAASALRGAAELAGFCAVLRPSRVFCRNLAGLWPKSKLQLARAAAARTRNGLANCKRLCSRAGNEHGAAMAAVVGEEEK